MAKERATNLKQCAMLALANKLRPEHAPVLIEELTHLTKSDIAPTEANGTYTRQQIRKAVLDLLTETANFLVEDSGLPQDGSDPALKLNRS